MKSSVTFAVCGIAILFLVLASECKPALDDPLLTTVQATTTTDPATVDDLKDIPDHLIVSNIVAQIFVDNLDLHFNFRY